MKGLIRKEWYSLWSQYRIHMLAMLGLGVLLPIIKIQTFSRMNLLDILCSNNDFLYSNAFGRI